MRRTSKVRVIAETLLHSFLGVGGEDMLRCHIYDVVYCYVDPLCKTS